MLRNILIFAVVATAFAVGGRLGGQVGSIVAGVAAFAVGLLVAERMEHPREARGYWLRHRAAFLEFGLVVVGIAIGAGLLGGFPGFLVGSCSGAWAGWWLGRRWGWSGPALQGQMEARSGYLAVLVSAADADGVITPAEAGRIGEVGLEQLGALADLARDLIGRVDITAIVDSDPGSSSGEAAGHGRADPPPSAGDENRLAREINLHAQASAIADWRASDRLTCLAFLFRPFAGVYAYASPATTGGTP